MRLLFEIDKKDYQDCTRSYVRPSARSIIIRGERIAMVHSLKYDYYKFPGGGIDAGETPLEAMIRETQEEAGLVVIPETVQEYGYVHRIQRSDEDFAEIFVQDNYYFFCQANEHPSAQSLDDYEADEHFTLEFVDAQTAIRKNSEVGDTPYNRAMFERENRVLEMLVEEGYL